MDRIRKNNQKKVIVTLMTTFEYPVSVLPNPKHDTAVSKAFQEFTEKHKCLSLDTACFTHHIEETEGFTFKCIPEDSPRGLGRRQDTLQWDNTIRQLANAEFILLHGSLEPDKNPGIFIFSEPYVNGKGEVLEEAPAPMMRGEYADILFNLERKYIRILEPH